MKSDMPVRYDKMEKYRRYYAKKTREFLIREVVEAQKVKLYFCSGDDTIIGMTFTTDALLYLYRQTITTKKRLKLNELFHPVIHEVALWCRSNKVGEVILKLEYNDTIFLFSRVVVRRFIQWDDTYKRLSIWAPRYDDIFKDKIKKIMATFFTTFPPDKAADKRISTYDFGYNPSNRFGAMINWPGLEKSGLTRKNGKVYINF